MKIHSHIVLKIFVLISSMSSEMLYLIDSRLGHMLRSAYRHEKSNRELVRIGERFFYPVSWMKKPDFLDDYDFFCIKLAFVVLQYRKADLAEKIPSNLEGNHCDLLWILLSYNVGSGLYPSIPKFYQEFMDLVQTLIPEAATHGFNMDAARTEHDFNSLVRRVLYKTQSAAIMLKGKIESPDL